MKRIIQYIAIAFLGIFIIQSCSSNSTGKAPVVQTQGVLDTVEFHTERGDRALIEEDFKGAQSDYEKALRINPNYSPALSGQGAAIAMSYAAENFSKTRKEDAYLTVSKIMQQAEKNASESEHKIRFHENFLHVHTVLEQPKNWLNLAQGHFKKGIALAPTRPKLYLLMARGETKNFNFSQATQHYEKVLSLNDQYVKEANAELKVTQRIQRARPGSRFGKTVALEKRMSKADIAGILTSELNVKEIYRHNNVKIPTPYTTPKTQKKFVAGVQATPPKATDILGHPLESSIIDILDLSIRGLAADASHRFHPNKPITRAEYAVMLEDILSRITDAPQLKTQYVGTPSPFSDVRSDVWYYNAARVVIERQLMPLEDPVNNYFLPQEAVSGADALLALRELKTALKSYLP